MAKGSGSAPGPRFVVGDAGFYFSEDTPQAVADAVCRVHARRDELTAWLAAARARAEREFSVAAAGARLRTLLNRQ